MVILRGAQDVQICDLIHKSVNWQRPLVLPAWWPPTIWIFYFIIKIELGIPRAGHLAESTRLSDLWLYWITCLLTGTVPWFSLLDGHPTKRTTRYYIFNHYFLLLACWYCYYSHKTGVAHNFILMAWTLGTSSSHTISLF